MHKLLQLFSYVSAGVQILMLVFVTSVCFAQIDSAQIQNIVQTGNAIGQSFLPPSVQPFGTLITFAITALTAFFIRLAEKRRLKKQGKLI